MRAYERSRRLVHRTLRLLTHRRKGGRERGANSPYMSLPRFMSGMQIRYTREGRPPPGVAPPEEPRGYQSH